MLNRTVEKRSIEVLNELSIKSLPVPINKIIKQYGIKVKEEIMGDSVSGFLVSKRGKNLIGVNALESEPRKRFTKAHEFGHFILHSNKEDDLFISKIHFRDEDSSTGEMKREREANAFAAGILMPQFLIDEELDKIHENTAVEKVIDVLSKKFKVSEIAMSYRLSNLGYIRRF